MVRNVLATGLIGLVVFVGVGNTTSVRADEEKITYYVQLVRGSNDLEAPETGAHRIGPTLSKRFHSVFKWDNYWEIKRQKVDLALGQKSKIRLNKDREVEIDLKDAAHRTVVAFQSGKPVSRMIHPIGAGMTIIGGDRDEKSVWFIVVRRDPPSD